MLVDKAMALVTAFIPEPSREVRKRRLAAGLRACARAGLTSVHDAGVPLGVVGLYKELLAEGALPVRVYVMLKADEFLDGGAFLAPEIGLGDGRLTVRAIKVVADGALGSRGAMLLAPYSDEPGTRGWPPERTGRRSLSLRWPRGSRWRPTPSRRHRRAPRTRRLRARRRARALHPHDSAGPGPPSCQPLQGP